MFELILFATICFNVYVLFKLIVAFVQTVTVLFKTLFSLTFLVGKIMFFSALIWLIGKILT